MFSCSGAVSIQQFNYQFASCFAICVCVYLCVFSVGLCECRPGRNTLVCVHRTFIHARPCFASLFSTSLVFAFLQSSVILFDLQFSFCFLNMPSRWPWRCCSVVFGCRFKSNNELWNRWCSHGLCPAFPVLYCFVFRRLVCSTPRPRSIVCCTLHFCQFVPPFRHPWSRARFHPPCLMLGHLWFWLRRIV